MNDVSYTIFRKYKKLDEIIGIAVLFSSWLMNIFQCFFHYYSGFKLNYFLFNKLVSDNSQIVTSIPIKIDFERNNSIDKNQQSSQIRIKIERENENSRNINKSDRKLINLNNEEKKDENKNEEEVSYSKKIEAENVIKKLKIENNLIKMNLFQRIKASFKCGKGSKLQKMIHYFSEKIFAKFDLFYYISKLKSLKKLKNIFFEEKRKKLINFYSKIQGNIKSYERIEKEKNNSKNHNFVDYFMDLDDNNEIDIKLKKILNENL